VGAYCESGTEHLAVKEGDWDICRTRRFQGFTLPLETLMASTPGRHGAAGRISKWWGLRFNIWLEADAGTEQADQRDARFDVA